jgi:hypothetical protein
MCRRRRGISQSFFAERAALRSAAHGRRSRAAARRPCSADTASARRPLIVAGGGEHYADGAGCARGDCSCKATAFRWRETQAGRGAVTAGIIPRQRGCRCGVTDPHERGESRSGRAERPGQRESATRLQEFSRPGRTGCSRPPPPPPHPPADPAVRVACDQRGASRSRQARTRSRCSAMRCAASRTCSVATRRLGLPTAHAELQAIAELVARWQQGSAAAAVADARAGATLGRGGGSASVNDALAVTTGPWPGRGRRSAGGLHKLWAAPTRPRTAYPRRVRLLVQWEQRSPCGLGVHARVCPRLRACSCWWATRSYLIAELEIADGGPRSVASSSSYSARTIAARAASTGCSVACRR